MTQRPIRDIVRKFMKFPGVGERSALRFTLFLLNSPDAFLKSFVRDILELREKVSLCEECFNITQKGERICDICQDSSRDPGLLCVVEGIEDIISIEKSRTFSGRYHILWGKLGSRDGFSPDDLKIKELVRRVEGGVKEIIIAMDTTVEGEATAIYLSRVLKPLGVRITRPAYGIPMGAEIEFMDQVTIKKAFERREEFKS